MERYIWLNGKRILVTQEVYKAYLRPLWREKKQRITRSKREISFDCVSNSMGSGVQASAEEVFFKEYLAEELHHALNMLTLDEYNLIMMIYFGGYSEREIAKKINLSQKAVNKRKNHILIKLKKNIFR